MRRIGPFHTLNLFKPFHVDISLNYSWSDPYGQRGSSKLRSIGVKLLSQRYLVYFLPHTVSAGC